MSSKDTSCFNCWGLPRALICLVLWGLVASSFACFITVTFVRASDLGTKIAKSYFKGPYILPSEQLLPVSTSATNHASTKQTTA